MNQEKTITLKKVLTYLMIVVVALVCAVNYQLFVFPNRFAPAGLNGICTMVQHVFDFNVGYLNLLINVPLAVVVYFLVGKPRAVRSMVYTVSFSLFLLLLDKVDLSSFAYTTENGTSTILGPLVAGIITGSCAALLFRANATTGGTEFISSIIHKHHPEVNFFWITFALDVAVALISYFVYDFQTEPVLLCIMYCFASSSIRNRMTQNGNSAVRFEIVTDYPQEISQDIIQNLHHSVTLTHGQGMYRQTEKSILVCVINKSQVPDLIAIVRKYPHSFTVMSEVTQVIGNFKRLDSRGNPEKQLLDKGN